MVNRFVIAAASSGSGKTTVATGLMAALTARGTAVAPFKIGPDYIDPGYHGLATGRPGRNLDPWLCGEERIAPLFLHGAQGADVAIVEGVMGLFDGKLGTRGFGSTAHVARLLDAPVVLVIDARHTSRTVGATVLGLASFDPSLRVGGVILNQVGSPRHGAEARDAVEQAGFPVLGELPRNLEIEAPSRHLGLVPAAERDHTGVAAMGNTVAEHLDLDAILALGASSPALDVEPWNPADEVTPLTENRPRIAVAGGRAFTFRYPETDELLVAAGCEVVEFDPLRDSALPAGASGLWLGGGFPEVYAGELSGNQELASDIRRAVEAGLPTVAECAGLLYLARSLDGHPMVGALDAESAMHPRLVLGYRTAEASSENLLGRPGEAVTGHEFHRTRTEVAEGTPAWVLDGKPDGVATDTVHASYLHVHWAGHPQLAQRFADAAHTFAQSAAAGVASGSEPIVGRAPFGAPATTTVETPSDAVDLLHHGDRDLGEGLIDFAVNLRQATTPPWLVKAIRASGWAAYPDASRAKAAIAQRHGVDPAMVLPCAGAAEAFTLIARALPGSSTVVHPQFTEPEAALRAAGRTPRRAVLTPQTGFTLTPSQVAPSDLIIVGNPTNPTGVLHPAPSLLALPAGVLVVDEAFLDAVPGEPGTLIAPEMPGRLVLRSLTKTWALAGLRAGYVVGDPELIERLAEQQPPWSVSTPAAEAMVATTSDRALRQSHLLAVEAAAHRADLEANLRCIGLDPVPGVAPFVLVNTASLSRQSLRSAMADRGFAVRRGESFPGLGPTWLRLAVRTPAQHRRLAEALMLCQEATA